MLTEVEDQRVAVVPAAARMIGADISQRLQAQFDLGMMSAVDRIS
jgi:hypothetical protein